MVCGPVSSKGGLWGGGQGGHAARNFVLFVPVRAPKCAPFHLWSRWHEVSQGLMGLVFFVGSSVGFIGSRAGEVTAARVFGSCCA